VSSGVNFVEVDLNRSGNRQALRQHDPRVEMDLQALLDHTYASGRYHRRFDYARACDPPLEADDASWAETLLRQAGKR